MCLSVYLLVTSVSPEKNGWPIKMLFCVLTHAAQPYIRWTWGWLLPQEWALWEYCNSRTCPFLPAAIRPLAISAVAASAVFVLDVFGAVLRCGQSLQAAANLLGESGWAVQGQEATWSASTRLCHCRPGLPQHAARLACYLLQFNPHVSWN